jgi:hypothetical protein
MALNAPGDSVTMKLYQPLMFVGLGGTGCQIGAELERRLREEICGPDGADFRRRREDALRYELPACLQFVYADVNQADLDRLPSMVVPGPQHSPAVRRTSHFARGLVPRADTYPEVARDLRLTAYDTVAGWLPPQHGEPRVSPLQRGAGQLPTIGRAALFETFRNGIGPAIRELNEAVGRLSTAQAATDLFKLADGGRSDPAAVDVFVAFSVAGGTGAGIFYDYLHLIGDLFAQTSVKPKIYPLVLMPSAFPEGLGGGRPARLNAGRALLDLFRLVDQQNGGDTERQPRGHDDQGPIDLDEIAVRYPQRGRVTLRAGIVQTGFLFSLPVGAEPDDLRRSVTSLILSLAGTELDDQAAADGAQPQSFADSFINAAVERQIPAENGIGNRGVSTALVASLTVPVDELAGLVAGRLLGGGIDDLETPLGGAESNRPAIERFFTLANLHPVFARQQEEFAEPEPVRGARNITVALNDRLEAMRASLGELRARLERDVPKLVDEFDPRVAVQQLLADYDPFRLRRIVFGHPDLSDDVDRLGAAQLMQRRRQAPPPPDGLKEVAPPVPQLRDRLGGFAAVRWDDPDPVQALQDQDDWYAWRTKALWTEPWSSLSPRWRRQLAVVEENLTELTETLAKRARQDWERFGTRADHLRRSRVGVSYLLPPGGDLEQFYQRVINRLTDTKVAAGQLKPGAGEAGLLNNLIGAAGWRQAFATLSEDRNAEQAVDELKERLKAEIKTCFQQAEPQRTALLPRLADQLAQAASQSSGTLSAEDLGEFRAKLAGLVPANFTPQGTGQMKVLVSYPAGARNPAIEYYLRRTVNLPAGDDITFQFTPTTAESIAVVLFRSSMGITEVREVREVLRAWSNAVDQPLPQDYLRWRQRTGYDFGYLATQEEHRVQILHRLLCALWNGRVRVDGDPASPSAITVEMSGGVTMRLPLQPLDRASSWGSLLRAYELWALGGDEQIRRDICAQLMLVVPTGVNTKPVRPYEHYWTLRAVGDKQVAVIDRMLADLHSGAQARARQLRSFWAETLPAALDREFTEVQAIRRNLRELEGAVDRAVDDNGADLWESR